MVYEERARAWTEAPVHLGQLWKQRYRWCYGTMQAMWKHRRAIVERGDSGRFGRRGLLAMLLFQVLLPLTAPAMDAFLLYGLFFLDLRDDGSALGRLPRRAAGDGGGTRSGSTASRRRRCGRCRCSRSSTGS